MQEWEQRTELLLGADAISRLVSSRVLIVGVGGVGAYAAELIARAGVGHITIIDGDDVAPSNINRQLPALHSTVGLPKVEVMSRRIKDINPEAEIEVVKGFITAESVADVVGDRYDAVVDAIDAIAPKVALLEYCVKHHVAVVSSMGAGGRTDPTKVTYADIAKTYNDGLAKVVRTRLREKGVRRGVMTVWSSELPRKQALIATSEIACKRTSYGTVSYLPCLFGTMLAAYVIRKLTETK